jgi:hypothetical protein
MNDSTLARLRAANPVPAPLPLDDPDLFRRIVSTPRQNEGRRRSPRRRRLLVAAVAIAVVAMASTALAISGLVGSSVVKPPVTLREYRLAQRQLILPPGETWPKLHVGSDSVTGRGAGGGHAVLIAQNRWECYWARAIRIGDEAAQRRAHSVLAGLLAHNVLVAPPGAPEDYVPSHPPKVPYAVMADDGGYQFMQRTLDQAAAGHPRQLIESCRANR